jgi:DNA-nicking Smr family endonuclease
MSGDDRKRPRRSKLSPEDEEIWAVVARTVKPLRRTKAAPPPPAPTQSAPPRPPKAERPVAAPAHPPAPRPRAAPQPPRMQPVEAKIKRKLARGKIDVDMKLDLHGMRQGEAREALLRFMGRARRDGARVVAVVTGKGRGSGSGPIDPGDFTPRPGGVLQRMVRLWLAAPELRDSVIGFDEADAAHGGAGALYVRVRRDRSAT